MLLKKALRDVTSSCGGVDCHVIKLAFSQSPSGSTMTRWQQIIHWWWAITVELSVFYSPIDIGPNP